MLQKELCLRGGEWSGEERQGSPIYSLITESDSQLRSQRWLKMAPSLSTLCALKRGGAADCQHQDGLTQTNDIAFFSPCVKFRRHTSGEMQAFYES